MKYAIWLRGRRDLTRQEVSGCSNSILVSECKILTKNRIFEQLLALGGGRSYGCGGAQIGGLVHIRVRTRLFGLDTLGVERQAVGLDAAARVYPCREAKSPFHWLVHRIRRSSYSTKKRSLSYSYPQEKAERLHRHHHPCELHTIEVGDFLVPHN